MAISVEWILNSAKKKIYAISHAKAVVRNNSTVDADLTKLENNVEELQNGNNTINDAIDIINGVLTDQNVLNEDFANHIDTELKTENGIHGIRHYDDKLQFFDGETWVTIETGSGKMPPVDMKSVEVTYSNDITSLILKWSDPDDIVSGNGQVLSKWQGTKVVRKVGSYPTKVSDGTLVCDCQVRDQYKDTGFIDSELATGVTYYYRWFPYSDQGAVNLNKDINRASKKTFNKYTIVGVTADWANNTYTRTDKAIGKSAGTPFNEFKAFGGRRRCIVADDKTILAFYGDSAYTETGKLTQSVTKNGKTYGVGTSAQVMVYQPKFYYKVTPITKVSNPFGTGFMIRKATYQVADDPYPGFKIHPDFKRNGKEFPYILVSAFECTSQDSSGNYLTTYGALGTKLASIAGAIPATGGSAGGDGYSGILPIGKARELAEARGTDWKLGDILTTSATQILAMIEYASMNLQNVLAVGNVDVGGATNYVPYIKKTGTTSNLGNTSGRAAGTPVNQQCMSYRGEENVYGNIFTYVDGLAAYNNNQAIMYWTDHNFTNTIYSQNNPSKYCQSTGFNFVKNSKRGWISAFGYSDSCDFMFIPCEYNGDSVNPVGDYFYALPAASATTAVIWGGNVNRGLEAGLFNFDVDVVFNHSSWSTGARLVCIPNENAIEELPEELLT